MLRSPFLFLVLPTFLILASSCRSEKAIDEQLPLSPSPEDIEAREDSLEMAVAYTLQEQITLMVTPDVETKAVLAGELDDAADDPAVWVNAADPARSIVIGSNKRGGIATYDLEGKELAYYPVGKINNVDVIYQVKIGDERVDLVGGSNRSDQSIDLFKMDPGSGELRDISADPFRMDSTLMDDVYGFCFYQSPKNQAAYVMINAKNGHFQQYLITSAENGLAGLKLVREIQFDSQVEGMVADNQYGHLYIGEEGRGVWKMDAEPDGSLERKLVPMSGEDNENIAFDVEGITLFERDSSGYLIVSSQGNFSYAVFDRLGDNSYLFSFKIMASETVDGVEETDGIQAISLGLGPNFPHGVFVAQDGFNHDGDTLSPQNFKLVRWEKIEALQE